MKALAVHVTKEMEREKESVWKLKPLCLDLQNQKDIPVQLLVSTKPLQASIVIGSFGASQGVNAHVFNLETTTDASLPPPSYEKPARYGKKPEIHHTFKADPRSPPKVISLFFVLAVLATIPALFVGVRLEFLPSS